MMLGKRNGKMIGTSKLNGRIGNNGDEVLARMTKWGHGDFSVRK